MADRYWVGGTASWDATAGTKWATTSGGAGGAAVPTSADDVFFDDNSGAVTVTISGTRACRTLYFYNISTLNGFVGSFAGTATPVINMSGGIDYGPASMTGFSTTIALNFVATTTGWGLVFPPITVGPVTFNGAGGGWTDFGGFTSVGALTVTAGSFTATGGSITATSLSSSNNNTRTINLGSSTVTLSATTNTVVLTNYTGLTFNAGTSNIVFSGAGSTISLGVFTAPITPQTFYNLSYTSTTASTHTFLLSGVPVLQTAIFNNMTVTAPASAGVTQVTFNYPVTINGTLSTTGTAGNRRVWFRSNTYGIAQTLTINSAPSLTDADFRDIYVIGTAAPISGTRIGDLRGCRGIAFDAPKTVYWNLAAGGNWSANAWAATSGGAVSTDNFPLAQDTAVIENTGLNMSATITLDAAIAYMGAMDASTRTNAWTLTGTTGYTVYGDYTNGPNITHTGTKTFTFSGRNTQVIKCSNRGFPISVTVDSYGGTVELGDAFNIGSTALTITNGTFDTQNYNVTAGSLSSSNTNVRTINLGSSTVTLSDTLPVTLTTSTNLTLNAGTSTISMSSNSTFSGGGNTFYDVSFTRTATNNSHSITGQNTFNSLTVSSGSSDSLTRVTLAENQTTTGTLTVAGASPVCRIFLRSDVLGTQRDLTVGTLVANDCDFRDIEILGAAIGTAPTRAGDCGGNNNITFPAPKIVYWNLAGTQNWSSTGWASTSGGTPDINNFPLAQDTAVFDNTGTVGSVTMNAAWNIGTFDASARTTGASISISTGPFIYSNFLVGTGIGYSSGPAVFTFAGRGTSTITSNGISLGHGITIDNFSGTVQLADALTLNSARTLVLTSGTFDAVTYNVTTGLFTPSTATNTTLKMGSGTWTISGVGNVWMASSVVGVLYKGTANIVLSDTSTSARTFNGAALSYNKLTVGGTTGTSTLTIAGNNQFTELASTKTVAHTIALGTTTQTFGAWTVTGTAGNVVTVTGTAALTIAGARVSGVDYLAMGTTTVSATSPGEFYSGANSTGTGANVIKTAAPTPVTRYWVGGTGTWDATTTTKWSDTSGGAGGASVPTSADAVVFDTLSNATAYTVTCTATQLRCGALTMAGPLVGNVTWAGTASLAIHDNVSLAATGITRTYGGAITLSSSSTGKTLTTNGVVLASFIIVNGIGCEWSLGSALNIGTFGVTVTNGSLGLVSYNLTAGLVSSSNNNTRTVDFGSGTTTLSSILPIDFGTTETARANLTATAGTSQINCSAGSPTVNCNNQTFNNVQFTSTGIGVITINGVNTFNNLTVAGQSGAGVAMVSFTSDQTVNGTLTLSAGTNATCRTFVRSDTLGTTRTITAAAVSATDIDFRDIIIAGAAAPVSGTRLGDCKGNSGITFPAAKTVYYNSSTSGNWSGTVWWHTANGVNNNYIYFPLAQDTVIVPAPYLASGATITINAAYNIGTIDMSARTSNTMTLATGITIPFIYGNWINGTGTTLTGTGVMTFAGRGSQTITSAGKTFTQGFTINTPGGSVTLQDAFITSSSSNFAHTAGTFDGNGFNFTLSSSGAPFASTGTATRTLAMGSGTWTFATTGTGFSAATTGLTVTGTGTISLTSASAKTFAGGGISYSGITLDQGGAGTLTITGNNTFANISNTYKSTGATTIAMGTTTQTVGNFTASGEAGRVLTVQGSSAASPATLIFSGSGQATQPSTDYLTITGVRAYSLDTTWYAGANSTNNGSLGWYFEAGGGGPILVYIIESSTASSTESPTGTYNPSVSETTTLTDSAIAGMLYLGELAENATVADSVSAFRAFLGAIIEAAVSAEVTRAALVLSATLAEATQAADTAQARAVLNSSVQELTQGADATTGGLLFLSSVLEASQAQELTAAFLTFNRAVTESAATLDAVAVIASTFSAAASDTARPMDAVQGANTGSSSLSEAASASETATAKFNPSTSVTEQVVAQDTQSALAVFRAPVSETATALDSSSVAPSVFSAIATATAAVFDSPNPAGSIYNAVLPIQGAGITDSFIGAYLWNLINDAQDPGWAGIQTPQNPGWSVIDDSQSPGWQNINIT